MDQNLLYAIYAVVVILVIYAIYRYYGDTHMKCTTAADCKSATDTCEGGYCKSAPTSTSSWW
jgi:hypothetical protein